MEIDFGLALDFIDDRGDGRPYQLRFRRNNHLSDRGQLIAVIASNNRPDNGHTVQISRADVALAEVEHALDGWQSWAQIDDWTVSLNRIQSAITTAGLG